METTSRRGSGPEWSLYTIKGDKHLPSNYRAIGIACSLSEVYETVLLKRFVLWYTPNREQAGATAGRSCTEQITTRRLVIDVAWKTGKPLYIVFIDYVKACDNVNRQILLQILDKKGCGTKFIRAISNSFHGIRRDYRIEYF